MSGIGLLREASVNLLRFLPPIDMGVLFLSASMSRKASPSGFQPCPKAALREFWADLASFPLSSR